MPESLSGLLTFLFTDIEGSVHLWERDPARMAGMLDRHSEIIAACVRAHNGQFVRERGEGDSTFSIYARPADGAAAAAALQRAMHAEPWPAEMGVRVRAALHTGTAYAALSSGNSADYNSPTVNRCARLRALAHGGQIFLTEVTYQLLRDEVYDYELRDLGFHHLKDLRRPERVYQIVCDSVPAGEPPGSEDILPSTLPEPLGPFIGRRAETESVRAQMERARLVTITGLGGSGKSRLAREVAAGLMDTFSQAVWWVEAGEDAPGRAAETMLEALRLSPEAGQDSFTLVRKFLAPRRALLILDGCERNRSEWRDMAGALLRACPDLRLIATGQAPLGTPGESLFALGPMAFPPSLTLPLDALRSTDCLALFEMSAQMAAPGFRLTTANAAAASQICHAVDGLPLGIELAAACVALLDLDALAKRLTDPLSLPHDPDGDGRSLLSALHRSYELLNETERTALRRLSIFEGGWGLEAAEAIGGTAGGDLLTALLTLVRRSLVVREDAGGVPRYRMPRTVAGYARRRLTEAAESEAAGKAHREFFAALAVRGAEAASDSESDWLNVLEHERANLTAALRSFAAAGEAAAGLQMARCLHRLWSLRGPAGEAMALLDILLASRPEPPPASRASGLTTRGALASTRGEFKVAQADFQAARLIREHLADRAGVADLDNNLGNVAWDQGNFNEAETLFRRSLAEFQEVDDKEGVAATECNLASLLLGLGRLDEAEAGFERSKEQDRAQGDFVGVAAALDGLGEIALHRGDLRNAWTQRSEALKLRRQIHDRPGMAESLEGLAEINAASDAPARAVLLLGAAERAREQAECPLPPRLRDVRRPLVEALRAALPEEYHEIWIRGYGMTMEEAVQTALEADTPSSAGVRKESSQT